MHTNIKNFKILNEKSYNFNKVRMKLDNKTDYVINGFYQSYKYFWNYQEEIKRYIFIDKDKVKSIGNTLNKYGKKILAIHVRLGDYIKLANYHCVQPLEYYKKALSYYTLEDYQIILFSDEIQAAKEKLSPLNLDYICANDVLTNDEDQFLMLCLCLNLTIIPVIIYLWLLAIFFQSIQSLPKPLLKIFLHLYWTHMVVHHLL